MSHSVSRHTPTALALSTLTAALFGCADTAHEDVAGPAAAEIRQGTPIVVPEACLVRVAEAPPRWFDLNGVLIAPDVVLTVGHAVAQKYQGVIHTFPAREVACPGSGSGEFIPVLEARTAPRYAVQSEDESWLRPGSLLVPPDRSDLALFKLDRRIALPKWPKLDLTTTRWAGKSAYGLGRVRNGRPTTSFFRSPTFPVARVDALNPEPLWIGVDTPFLEGGDSGGPVYDAETGTVIGVNAWLGCQPGTSVDTNVCAIMATLSGEGSWVKTTLAEWGWDEATLSAL